MAGRQSRRKRIQARFSMVMVLLAMLAIVATIGVRCLMLHRQLDGYESQKEKLQAQIAEEEQRTREIEDYGKYLETDQAVEEIARDRLGLVKKNVILFRNEDAQ